MLITSHTSARELDHRSGDGIDVTLLWDPQTRRVSIAVIDERTGEVLIFEVDSADALAAFHHPYAYAPRPPVARRPTATPHAAT